MNYEMRRQLHAGSGLSLSNYHTLVALSNAPHARMRVFDLATQIGRERSRVSHHLRRMWERCLIERQPSPDDGRATEAWLTAFGAKPLRKRHRARRACAAAVLRFDA